MLIILWYQADQALSKTAFFLQNRKKLGVYKSVFPSFFLATKPTIRNTWRSVPSLLQSLLNASLETQGRSVGSGEKARRSILSTGGKAPLYRLSPDHFQEVKRMLAPDLAQKNALYYCAQSANSFS